MAVIEELVSKLGFEVEGLAKLKAAAKQFDATKKSVIASANPLKQAGASAGIAAVGVGKLGTESKKSSRGVLLLTTAMTGLRRAGRVAVSILRGVLLVALRLAPAVLGIVAGLAAVALAFARAGSKAAMARREFSLAAKEIGTSAQNLETVGNVLRVAGFGDGFEEEAKKVVGAMDEVAKTIRKGGEDAVEAKKKFQGFGIDQSLNVDPKTGQSRDSAAIALDIFQAYKRATEQAANLRKQADALGSKAPKRAAALRRKAIEQDRKNEQFAEDAGISGKLKVLLDSIALKDLPRIIADAARLFPTTSNKSEGQQSEVAKQAIEAGLKVDALLKGTTDRLTDLGVALATHVLPPLNSFLDSLISFGKRTGLIKETKGEFDARTEADREANRARGFNGTRDETPNEVRRRTYEEGLDRLEHLKRQVSPETNAAKMQKQAAQKTDQRKYENIGNDQRTISPTVNVNATGLDAVAAAVKNSVLGAISTKGANTSTGALTAP
ncbi:hypothetical protein AB4Z40_08825 [Bosea sp. 2YAB26]|uniref:hypothetical protein n=1 Tax=Bosea sp. 2YAB26 TaxID=3237478 RepID=UPI003F8E90FF